MRHHRTPHIHRVSLFLALSAGMATQVSCDALTDLVSPSAEEPAKAAATAPDSTATPSAVITPASVAAPPVVAPALVPPVAVVATPKPATEIDVHALLEDKPAPTGVMAATAPGAIDASAAPRLGGDVTPPASLAQAKWEPLPGGRLSAAHPPGWTSDSNEKVTTLMAPGKKMGLLAMNFTSMEDASKKLDQIGAILKIETAKWTEPTTVKLGPDSLVTVLRQGDATGAGGKTWKLRVAFIETGTAEKLMVLVFGDADAPKGDLEQVKAMMTSIRRAA